MKESILTVSIFPKLSYSLAVSNSLESGQHQIGYQPMVSLAPVLSTPAPVPCTPAPVLCTVVPVLCTPALALFTLALYSVLRLCPLY